MRALLIFTVGLLIASARVSADEFAWQATDRFVPPDFEGFFPDDAEAGRVLDEQLSQGWTAKDAQELLEIVRRGLRRSTVRRSTILEFVGQQFIWRRPSETEPQHPYAIELMYHASAAPEFRDDAHYYGLQVVRGKTDNILRAILDHGYENVDRSVWGIKTYDDANQVAGRLLAMLNWPSELSPEATLTAYAIYRGLTGEAPSRPDRFKNVGSFVIVFEQADVGIDDDRTLEDWRTTFARDFHLTDELVDFTRRVSRGKAHQVALVRGIPTHDRLVVELAGRPRYSLVFSHRHTADDRQRLPEFHHHVVKGEKLEAPSWADQLADAKAVYAWNRTDKYVPPDYAGFFPDDAEAGRKLHALVAAGDKSAASDREILEIVRRGWRRSGSTPQSVLGWLSGRYVFWPGHPYAVEIFYHTIGAPASEPHRASGAVYFCFVNLKEKPENVLRALGETFLKAEYMDGSRNDLMRAFATEREKEYLAELLLKSLDNFESAPPLETVAAYEGYRALTGQIPPNAERYAGIGRFLVMFRRDEVKTPEELLKRFAEDYARESTVLETVARVDRNDICGVALVDGIAERDRLLEALQKDDRYSLDGAMPLTARVVEGKEGIPEFRQYLEPTTPEAAAEDPSGA